ncbi:MAG: ABC transporter substrate-binding protein [Candidatus Binatia bacterium]
MAVLVFALWVPAQAAQQARIPKIGQLSTSSLGASGRREFLGRELPPLGYVIGKNIAIEFRHADNKLDRLPALAEELVGLKVDVLVVGTTPGALAAKNATRTIPIVFHSVSDPIAVGLIDSLARPGGNITGTTDISAVLAGKRLELLKETVPNVSRVAVLWDPQNAASVQDWNESQLVARALGLQLHSMEVSSADEYPAAFTEAIKARSGALAVTGHSLALGNRKQIADLAIKNRLPAIYHRGDFVASGGLMFYGPDLAEQDRRVAVMVDKILKGTKPADIPVEQPKSFEFVVNLKAAKQIGLTIPPNLLVRAGKVIR